MIRAAVNAVRLASKAFAIGLVVELTIYEWLTVGEWVFYS